MKRLLIVHLCLFLSPLFANAQTHYVYESNTSNAYILLQPEPGVFLGQMMRNIGLQPSWTSRKWIKEIHYANSSVVDASGEILSHDQKLRVPLSALKGLKGYAQLERGFQPKELEPAPPIAPVVSEPVVMEPKKPVEPVVINDEKEKRVLSYKQHHVQVLMGAGAESLKADNGSGSDTTLNSSVNLLVRLDWKLQFNQNNRMGFLMQGQFKEYQDPSNITLVEGSSALFNVDYFYGYRLFNNFYLSVIGNSRMANFILFPGATLQLESAWVHSAGLMVDAPLFYFKHSQISFYASGLVSYTASADVDIDSGLFSRSGFKFEPKESGSGFVFGAEFVYQSQAPLGYDSHTSSEGFGYIGYEF
ncbi:MAG: hypothetical protein HRT44_10255 [Bdellovibrionales bacterium]|nr:hypothetical protein [Bdellovibrionales bacterium]NQZ19622.1 hypothetical protein [Bdellovibrionales bacterium]